MVEEFLGLPMRPPKPRERGWTHVIDKGMTLAEVEGLIETAGDYVDIVKLGWGTSYVTRNLGEKVRPTRRPGSRSCAAGRCSRRPSPAAGSTEFRRWTHELRLHARRGLGRHDPDRARAPSSS